MTNSDDLDTIRTILGAARAATVTTRSTASALHSRPLALLATDDFDGTLWFFTADPSPKTDDVRHDSQVNVSVGDGKGYLSLSGTATVSRDQAKIDELWNPFVEAWFPDGKADPSVALLEVDVETVEFWDLDKPAVGRLLETAKALITKTPPEVGENKTVSL